LLLPPGRFCRDQPFFKHRHLGSRTRLLGQNRPRKTQMSRVFPIPATVGRTDTGCPSYRPSVSRAARGGTGGIARAAHRPILLITRSDSMMRSTVHLASYVLVWLAAAPLAIQSAIPDDCGCQVPGQHAGWAEKGDSPHLAESAGGGAGCCARMGTAPFFRQAASTCDTRSGATQCACRPSRTASPDSGRRCWLCRCGCQESSSTPPITPPDNSRSVRETLSQAPLVSLPVRETRQDDGDATRQRFTPLAATSLQRLSLLCRFLI
jgi:hypothetical protein